MKKALFLNGVYESVLEEILISQKKFGMEINYLQPYATQNIGLLKEENPSAKEPITVYISTTVKLNNICYTAEIVAWDDKTLLDNKTIENLNKHIIRFQPGEEKLHLINDRGEEYKNLISVRNLKPMLNLYSVSILRKISDDTPLKTRTQAGKWAYVYKLPAIIEAEDIVFEEDLIQQQESEIEQSKALSSEARYNRLKTAPKKPEQIQTISKQYRRNADVIFEARLRANGICENCNKPAPFLKASDGTPYLEVHHKILLSEGGDDTIENAIAVCPNCHRRLHFGK